MRGIGYGSNGALEYWSIGVLETTIRLNPFFFSTPSLQYSNTPFSTLYESNY
jgi:hypothetical protein